jgi:hypothetical protein
MPSVVLTGGSPEARFLTFYFTAFLKKIKKHKCKGQAPQTEGKITKNTKF